VSRMLSVPSRRGVPGTDSHATPRALYDALHAEFAFTLDPCPLDESGTAGAPLWGKDGTRLSWRGERVFCNPPYSDIAPWVAKCREAEVAVYLLPARTDTAWWHEHAINADEIRFIRGRLRFGAAKTSALFPSVVLVYRAAVPPTETKPPEGA